MRAFTNKIVIITGASRGIGKATALAFAKAGAKIAAIATSLQSLSNTVAEVEALEGIIKAYACDVANPDQVGATLAFIKHDLGDPDILINNAGLIDPIARIEAIDPVHWGKVIDVNLKGPFNWINAVLPSMQAKGRGIIVNMSSGAATSALEGWSHYCASKAALASLTRCVHKEVADQGIRIVGLSPGTVATDMIASIHASGINPVSQLDPSVHIPPSDAAKAILWLCTDDARDFDGGDFSLKTPQGRKMVGLQ